MNYRTFQPGLMPTSLQDAVSQAFERGLGIFKDYLSKRANVGVKMRFPSVAPPDALGAIGSERAIDQGADAELVAQFGVNETQAAYAARLRDAWNVWRAGGTSFGLLGALAAQGYLPALIQENGLEFYFPSTIVTAAPFDVLVPKVWTTFVIYFQVAPATWLSIHNPPTPSSLPSIFELQKIRRIIDLWRPAWTKCAGIGVLTDQTHFPAFWGEPTRLWGTGTWGQSTVVWFPATNWYTWGLPPGPQRWGQAAMAWGGQT